MLQRDSRLSVCCPKFALLDPDCLLIVTEISASSYLFLFIPVPRVSEALLNEVIRSVNPPLGYLILHAVGVRIMPCLLPETRRTSINLIPDECVRLTIQFHSPLF